MKVTDLPMGGCSTATAHQQHLDAGTTVCENERRPLTTTQHSALGDLRRFGRLFAANGKCERGTVQGYSSRTLAALVDGGFARWDHPEGTAKSIVPEPVRWSIYFDPDEARPRTPHTQCPSCGTLDHIVEVDQAVRWNRLTLSSNGATATASTGDGDWDFYGWLCTSCMNSGFDAPEGFEILDWY